MYSRAKTHAKAIQPFDYLYYGELDEKLIVKREKKNSHRYLRHKEKQLDKQTLKDLSNGKYDEAKAIYD